MLLLVFFLLHMVTLQALKHPLFKNGTPDDTFGCGDCSGINYNAGDGYRCHQDDQESVIRDKCLNESVYPECVPCYFDIKYPIKEYCCFWSPKVGCGILVNEKYFNDKKICNKCESYCHRKKESGAWQEKVEHKFVIAISLIFVACIQFEKYAFNSIIRLELFHSHHHRP
ncbi:uncharacterized protein [Drosophila takahashii]|uniref:uncharacterized protein isoform X1 n=1 Tax=Drosophila takahashii TaxID=29030 RepID=UPI0007E61A9C|nr:uncharacterized protein LOC108060805 isoform X1 [Drosophila takahashii]XP_044251703.1 uncharacterized protein LOC108060805 isoform X1 [Drosophila takahashii]